MHTYTLIVEPRIDSLGRDVILWAIFPRARPEDNIGKARREGSAAVTSIAYGLGAFPQTSTKAVPELNLELGDGERELRCIANLPGARDDGVQPRRLWNAIDILCNLREAEKTANRCILAGIHAKGKG